MQTATSIQTEVLSPFRSILCIFIYLEIYSDILKNKCDLNLNSFSCGLNLT